MRRVKQVAVTIDPEDLQVLEKWSKNDGTTVSGLIRMIVHREVRVHTGCAQDMASASPAAAPTPSVAAPAARKPGQIRPLISEKAAAAERAAEIAAVIDPLGNI